MFSSSLILILIVLCRDNSSNRRHNRRLGNMNACDNGSSCTANDLSCSESVCQEVVPLACESVAETVFEPTSDSALTPEFEVDLRSAYVSDSRLVPRRKVREQVNALNVLESYLREELQARSNISSITGSSGSINLTGNSGVQNCETDYSPETLYTQEDSSIDSDVTHSQNTGNTSGPNKIDRAKKFFIRNIR